MEGLQPMSPPVSRPNNPEASNNGGSPKTSARKKKNNKWFDQQRKARGGRGRGRNKKRTGESGDRPGADRSQSNSDTGEHNGNGHTEHRQVTGHDHEEGHDEVETPTTPDVDRAAEAGLEAGKRKRDRRNRNWKPYSQLSWEEKKALDEKVKPVPPEIPAIPTNKRGKRRKGITLQDYCPHAPRNTTSDILEAHSRDRLNSLNKLISPDVAAAFGATPLDTPAAAMGSFLGANDLPTSLYGQLTNEDNNSSDDLHGLPDAPPEVLERLEVQRRRIRELENENMVMKLRMENLEKVVAAAFGREPLEQSNSSQPSAEPVAEPATPPVGAMDES